MTVSYVNDGGLQGFSSANSVTVAVPASIVAGNLLILFWGNRTNQVTMNDPTGWTVGGRVGPNTIGVWYWKIATGFETNFTLTWGANSVNGICRCVQYTGNHPTAPIGASNIASGTTATAITCASITATAASSTAIMMICDPSNNGTVGTPTSWTKDDGSASASGSDIICHQALGSIGSTSTAVSQGSSSRWYTMSAELILAPPPSISGTAQQTLFKVTQAATGALWAKGVAAQTLKNIIQAATGSDSPAGTVVQTLGRATQHVVAYEAAMWGQVTQTLSQMTQVANGWAEETGAIVQNLGQITQRATGTFAAGCVGAIEQTLGLITQVGAGTEEFVGGITQILSSPTQVAHGWTDITGAAAQMLRNIVITGAGTASGVTEIGGIIQTFIHPLTQQARGWMEPEGAIVQTLQTAQQAAKGWAEIVGNAVQTLPRLQQAVYAAELTLDTLYLATKAQLNAAIAAVEKQIRTTWHGPPDDPLPPEL